MNNADSQKIVARFFEAIEFLKDTKVIKGKATFAKKYGINRLNLYTLEKDHTSNIFQPAWLSYLVTDYKISPLWLLVGKGKISTMKEPKTTLDPTTKNSVK